MIEATGVVKLRNGKRALDGVGLSVRAGEVAALVGPSGGGKTTLLRCLNGLERFDAGAIAVAGHALVPGPVPETTLRGVRRAVGMVFQQFHLFPHLTALRNVALAAETVLGMARPAAEAEAAALLERLGLGERRHARPAELSGGQQQRVAIARALAVKPRAMLFDEPTSALDPANVGQVAALLRELAGEGLALAVVSHDLPFVRQAADTVHVFEAGRVSRSGPVADFAAA